MHRLDICFQFSLNPFDKLLLIGYCVSKSNADKVVYGERHLTYLVEVRYQWVDIHSLFQNV